MAAAKKRLIYLYCVTNRMPQLKEERQGIYFINHQGLYAVVGRVPQGEFSEENLKKNLSNMEWLKTKAGIHEKIIEGVMKDSCVVPYKFATLFNTEDSLKAMLKEHSAGLSEHLRNLENKEEWGIKIYCDMKILSNVISKDEEILMIDQEIHSSPPGKAFFLEKKKEDLLKEIINKKIIICGQYGFDKLRERSLQARINRLLPKDVTEREEEMILNAAYLLDKNRVNSFINTVDILRTKYEKIGFYFDCTGPWPPYNFCDFAMEMVHGEKAN